jgi:hypothetical protein
MDAPIALYKKSSHFIQFFVKNESRINENIVKQAAYLSDSKGS